MAEWKEFTAPDGRKYYYNKATNESKWTNPEAAKASPAPAAAPSSVQVLPASPWSPLTDAPSMPRVALRSLEPVCGGFSCRLACVLDQES